MEKTFQQLRENPMSRKIRNKRWPTKSMVTGEIAEVNPSELEIIEEETNINLQTKNHEPHIGER